MAPSEVLSRGSSLSSMGKKGEIGGEGRHPIWGREGDILFLVTINLSLRMYWRGGWRGAEMIIVDVVGLWPG